jgi:hypothetical protein
MSSFKLECLVHGESPDAPWPTNALRFATEVECAAYGEDLFMRWLALKDKRVAPSEDEPNYRWDIEAHHATRIEGAA